ncbi:hypothetical protein [Dyadobacter sp. CY323]|uniref:hypothetical protein n=1 Tax=Dyadobacter sp. CY323 TaxID=2907302 RepID=UPI001F1F9E8A|nr:hypothetical protein [Dyadobacter sp. CY323]MCE6990838.1 hypothetical protein [Dyadobacter sp. CY323]
MKNITPVKKQISQTGRFLLIGFFVLIASLFFLYPQIFYCELVALSSFRSPNGQVYYSPGIPNAGQNKIRKTIGTAEMRVDSFYQGTKATPTFIICSTQEQYKKYCSSTEGAGCSIGTPWGSSYVILNAQGLNADVISHEMSHTELLARLGWWKTTTEIPQWFNEGLALMLDRRFVSNRDPVGRYLDYMDEWSYYTGGGEQVLELKDITSIKGFFNGGQRHVMRAYMSAGMEVSYWAVLSGKEGINQLISEMKTGKSFEESYHNSERIRARRYFKKLPTNPLRFQDSKKMAE